MHRCCNAGNHAAPAPPTALKRSPSGLASLLQWALPVTTLALVPKCPGCVAAYVLLFTGIGLSVPAAAAVRWTLIALSVVFLGWLAFRAARRMLAPPA